MAKVSNLRTYQWWLLITGVTMTKTSQIRPLLWKQLFRRTCLRWCLRICSSVTCSRVKRTSKTQILRKLRPKHWIGGEALYASCSTLIQWMMWTRAYDADRETHTMNFSHMQSTWKNTSKDNSSTMHWQPQDFRSSFKSHRFKYTKFFGTTLNEQTPSKVETKQEITTTLVNNRTDLLSLKFYSLSSIWH